MQRLASSPLLLLALAVSVCCCAAAAVPAKKTLVMTDTAEIRSSHSAFFSLLEANGHALTYSLPLDREPKLRMFGEFQFDNLILFAPEAEDLPALDADMLKEFMNSGRNVIVGVNSNLGEVVREILKDCGIEFDEKGTAAIDHFNFDASDADGLHTRLALSKFIQSPIMLPHVPDAPVLFSGIGHVAERSRLIARVLTGDLTTFSANPTERVTSMPESAGTETLLVSAVQTRNNARMIVSGSLDLFSNKFFSMAVSVGGKAYPKSGNKEFCGQLAQWALNGNGLLRASPFKHYSVEDESQMNPAVYRIKDEIAFAVTIEQLDGASQKWKPFVANDVQLELVMIDPYLRLTLKGDKGVFSAQFTLPDVYGVYKFVVDYHRLGYGNLEQSMQVSVRPFKHDEFERFIPVAFPYYASSFAMMAGFFVFGLVFLYSQ